jgi:hypothetical protein
MFWGIGIMEGNPAVQKSVYGAFTTYRVSPSEKNSMKNLLTAPTASFRRTLFRQKNTMEFNTDPDKINVPLQRLTITPSNVLVCVSMGACSMADGK